MFMGLDQRIHILRGKWFNSTIVPEISQTSVQL